MKFRVFSALFSFLLSFVCFSQTTLYFPNDELHEFVVYEKLLREAYSKIEINVEFVRMTGERGFLEAERGSVDGLPVRAEGVIDVTSNLIPVDIPYDELSIFAYSRADLPPIRSPEDLVGKEIVIVKSRKIIQALTSEIRNVMVDDAERAIELIKAGRSVYIVDFEGIIDLIIKNQGLEDIVFKHKPSLFTVRTFHYLHKKHRNLIPDITEVFRDMKQSGRMHELIWGHR